MKPGGEEIRTVSQQNTACPYRKSNPDVVMMESAEQWDGAIFEDARELLRDSAWTPEIAARAVETTIEGIWGRLYFSVAHISFEDAIQIMSLLLRMIFPTHIDAIMIKANALLTEDQESEA